jgi:hypothetical protein
MISADFIHAHCPRIVNMTVTPARSPSLSELPGRYLEEPASQGPFKVARKPVPESAFAPKPISHEDRTRQQMAAGRQMQSQVLQTLGVPRGSRPANKMDGPPSVAPSATAYSSQGGPAYAGNRPSGRRKPLDEVIPRKNWAITPEKYKALPQDPNDPRVLFHAAFYGSGPKTLQPPLNPQARGPMRTASGVSTQTYPPRTMPAPPLSPNNGFPVLRNARSWQAPPHAAPYSGAPVDNVPPPRPPKEALESEAPPHQSLPPPGSSNEPPPLPPRPWKK